MLILSSVDCNGSALGIAKDTGVTDYKGLKGKRVGWVVGSPALNQNTLAMLAFAGLKKEDVKVVEFSSFGAMWKGMLTNDIDAAYASTITANTREVDTSPRGLVWPALPHADTEGWKRLTAIGPYFTRHKATCGSAGLSKDAPREMATFPYPLFTVMGNMPADLGYAITKAMIDTYDIYKDGAPGASGLAVKQQTTQWSIPFHPGAVKAFKEAGIWKPEDEAHNQGLLKRQGILRAAWDGFLATSPPSDAAAFRDAWLAARKVALEKAGLSTAPN
jgi:TRAP transporter TAXI family solute receptor